MKKCKACGHEKALAAFQWIKLEGKYSASCKLCRNTRRNHRLKELAKERGVTVSTAYLRANPDKVADLRKSYRDRNSQHVQSIKESTPCADCGQRFPAVCMDFDHTSDDKAGDVSVLVLDGYSLAKIDAEIAKCEIVCSNCHRIRTANRAGWRSSVSC